MRMMTLTRRTLRKLTRAPQKALKRAWRPVRRIAVKGLFAALRRLPLRHDLIFFESFRGKSYSCNPKAISEEVQARGLPVVCVWSLLDTSVPVPAGVRKVRTMSLGYYYYHACAKVLVHNTEFKENLPIRPSQIYINTQHGTPLKLMGSDMVMHIPEIEGGGRRWNYNPKNGRWRHLVSPNPHTTEVFRRVFQFDGSVLEVGYPRNDVLFKRNNPDDLHSLKVKLGLPRDRRIILYAPTWRNQGASRTDRSFRLQFDLPRLEERLGATHALVLRLHHLVAGAAREEVASYGERLSQFVLDRSSEAYDVQELMLVADVLVTDYSSVMFDYAILQRPMVFFAYDLDEYSSATRGMYFDLNEIAPGPVVTDAAALVNTLATVDEWRPGYRERERVFRERFCPWDNGEAARKVVKAAILPALQQRH